MSTTSTENPTAAAAPEQPQQVDYFASFGSTGTFTFPDGKSWIEYKSMNEGEKKKFQQKTSRDLIMDRKSGDARMRVDPGTERHELLRTCCINWNLVRGGKVMPFTGPNFGDFLELADPKLIEDLEREVRKANPWLMDEMSVEDIDREISNLEEMRKVAKEREQGESSSSSK